MFPKLLYKYPSRPPVYTTWAVEYDNVIYHEDNLLKALRKWVYLFFSPALDFFFYRGNND